MRIFFVEGNIGTGKSTFLSQIEKRFPQYQVIYEPLDTWTGMVDSSGSNILEYFYKDMERYAYTFQNLAFISRVEMLSTIDKSKECVFIERSVWSDSNVFAKNCYENGTLSEIEYLLYKRWFKWATKNIVLPGTHKFIYLRCPANVSMERTTMRGRKEEQSITLSYSEQIHKQHEEWLASEEMKDKVIDVDANLNLLNDEEFDRIFSSLI